MFLDPRIILDTFDNCIQHIFSDAQIRFDERYEFFAIMGIHPHAVLQSQETILTHQPPQPVTCASPVLRHIKHDKPVSFVPSAWTLAFVRIRGQFERECAPALFCDCGVADSATFDETQKTLLGKPPRSRFCPIPEFVLVSHDAGECLKDIGSDHSNGENTRNPDSPEHRALYISSPPPHSRFRFYPRHIPNITPWRIDRDMGEMKDRKNNRGLAVLPVCKMYVLLMVGISS